MKREKGQNRKILAYMRKGHSITPLDALRLFGCFRLGARIFDLKQAGHNISREIVKVQRGARVARYSMEAAK